MDNKMKTCKDCIHFEVCCYVDMFLPPCDSFKDKSKFIELPCAIGDTVYEITYNRTACYNCDHYSDFYGIDQICDENKMLFPNIINNKKNICNKHYVEIEEYKTDLSWIIRQLEQFGKTVFLTREEAEKRLEELT